MSRMWWRRQAADEDAKDRHPGGGHAWNAKRVPERVRTNLTQALNDFPRKPWHAVEWKVWRNSLSLVFSTPLNFTFLTPQVTCVLQCCLCARDIERRVSMVDFKS